MKRLYSGLQDRSTRVRGKKLGLSKTSIFKRFLQQWGRIDNSLRGCINSVITMIYVIVITTSPEFPSRQPCEKTNPEQYNSSYHSINGSSCRHGYNIERPVTVDTAIRIDYFFPAGVHYCIPPRHAWISRVAHTGLGNAPPKLSDTP